jgi:signal transduction histidine kinase
MNVPLFTPAARRHARLMLRAIRPLADGLDRRFRAALGHPCDAATRRALLACAPTAAARLRSLEQFVEQVVYNGRRLAKLNLSPAGVGEALDRFDSLLAPRIADRFQPAREQLRLATLFTLNESYYGVREAETQAFYGLYRAETEAQDLEDLLRRFVGILTHAFRARAGRLILQDGGRHRKLSRPLYIERGAPNETLVADASMRGQHACYWSYPLGEAGLIQFGFATPYPWLPRELALLDAVAGRCAEAIERSRLRDEVRRLEAESRHAEREERRRIGRELHDEAGQSLLLLRLKLEMLERGAPPEMRAELAETRGIAEQTVLELRRIIAALSPAVLERLGLKAALRQLVARFGKMHPAEVHVRIGANSDGIPSQIQEVIYRVAQESLQNIVKHSRATRVNLFLQSADKRIRLSVRDNGAGMCGQPEANKLPTFGLAGMRERAALLGGTLSIGSEPGKGVTVRLDLPRNPALAGQNGMAGNGEDSGTTD